MPRGPVLRAKIKTRNNDGDGTGGPLRYCFKLSVTVLNLFVTLLLVNVLGCGGSSSSPQVDSSEPTDISLSSNTGNSPIRKQQHRHWR